MEVFYSDDIDLLNFKRQSITIKENTIVIDATSEKLQNIISEVSQGSFFFEENEYIIDNAIFLLDKKNEKQIFSLVETEKKIICFVHVKTALNKISFSHKNLEIKKLEPLSKAEIISYINMTCNNLNVNIFNEETLKHFIETVGNNPFSISTELRKVISYSYDTNLTCKDIDNLIYKVGEFDE
jgi:DNA polymerase III delta subunit